jgi:siroheme synthase-like protein
VEVRSYDPPEASAYRLVVSATGDPTVDAVVTADALAGGALVNRADSAPERHRERPAAGTILLPAVHRSGPVTVAVSTDGRSPALARWLRDRIAGALADVDVVTLATLMEEVRGWPTAGREPGSTVDWDAALDAVAPLVAAGRITEARELLAARTGRQV